MPTAVTPPKKKKKKKKMEAAAALLAELTFRDGVKEQISVKVENNLTSLIAAVQELNGVASRLLSELVEREKSRGHTQGEEEVEDSDEDDDGPEEPLNAEPHPPAKRTKT
ncbi:hypothetical protein D4764_19G0002300 [Takifugu flavidus]|uniref:Uncharacterized protein n=1 Tax=Takifugu flavidus TaxID=433684 RepID=A0A5C6NLH6_9TELE|nr:hypothetical protein D4764_19G0002300 [Takifugu flavidus]